MIFVYLQCERSRISYRGLMEQILAFLERLKKSLDKMEEKSPPKNRYNSSINLEISSGVPRSRSVHAVHANPEEHGESAVRLTYASSTTSSSSPCSTPLSSGRFTKAKSVNQIASKTSIGSTSTPMRQKDVGWNIQRRLNNKEARKSLPVMSKSAFDVTTESSAATYRFPKSPKLDPDLVPPEKLSQEAFR